MLKKIIPYSQVITMEKATNEVLRQLLRGTQSEMEELLPTLHPRSFSEYLSALSEEKGMSKAEVIHQSGIPRTYAYQLYQGTRRPSRDKVLILAIVLGCTIEECDRLLTLPRISIYMPKTPATRSSSFPSTITIRWSRWRSA